MGLFFKTFQYGSVDRHGNWNGLIKEVLEGPENGGADFAIADLVLPLTKRGGGNKDGQIQISIVEPFCSFLPHRA